MPIPPTSRTAMLDAMHQFDRGDRSPHGPKPETDWLGDVRHRYVIVEGERPYPVKEIIRLAVKGVTGEWFTRFVAGPSQANQYAENYHLTVVRKEDWLRASGRS